MKNFLDRWLYDPTLDNILLILGVLILIRALSAVLSRVLTRNIKDVQARHKARKVFAYLGYALAIIFLAIVYRHFLGGIAVALGVASAGVAFALQEVIISLAGWAAISLGNFFGPGDRIQVGEIRGDVIDIGLLRTTLMECGVWVEADLYTGRIVRIPNSVVFKKPVTNYSGDFPFLWDEITVPVKYGNDYGLARSILTQIINEVVGDYVARARTDWKEVSQKYFIDEKMIDTGVTLALTDNWVEFTVRYIVDFKQRRATKNIIFTRIVDEFEKTSGRVTIASSTFQLVDPPKFEIHLSEKP